ncbi:Aquaporin-1 [Lachnellula suecica]|uniref:Aquaporin-1 n=1 Tax=Lachnellula suecica TaxID=602035 RepID=A0A8T9BXC1_9HELO|nr:Aquaporin-1 [Lachnellula suecica]
MGLDDSSELPQHYGGRTTNGELIKRPVTPETPGSPGRVHYGSRRDYSPERTPVDAHFDGESNRAGPGGLRRRPSAANTNRRHSLGDYDRERPSFSSGEPLRRPLRSRDDGYYRDEYPPHPDYRNQSRPPRSYRNVDGWEKAPFPSSASKPYFDESRGDYRERDLERGEWSKEMKKSAESVDGYDYEAYKRGGNNIDLNAMSTEEGQQIMGLPYTMWMNSSFKNHLVATIGEFVGTTMFLFFAFAGTQVANIQSTAASDNSSTSNTTSGGATGFNIAVYLYISVIFGFSLMVNVWIFFRISGGLFNPAVTLGMVMVGALPIVRAMFLFVAQMAGGIAASAMVLGLFPTPLNVRTTLAGGASLAQGVFIEAILTAELIFTIFMLAKEKHKATFIAPVGIGLALFIAEMVGVYYTGGSLNPARSFGPCVVTATFDPEHWIYWVGPIVGTFIAVIFYKFIKMLEYEMANPGQDGDEENDPTKNEKKKEAILQARVARVRKNSLNSHIH